MNDINEFKLYNQLYKWRNSKFTNLDSKWVVLEDCENSGNRLIIKEILINELWEYETWLKVIRNVINRIV